MPHDAELEWEYDFRAYIVCDRSFSSVNRQGDLVAGCYPAQPDLKRHGIPARCSFRNDYVDLVDSHELWGQP